MFVLKCVLASSPTLPACALRVLLTANNLRHHACQLGIQILQVPKELEADEMGEPPSACCLLPSSTAPLACGSSTTSGALAEHLAVM